MLVLGVQHNDFLYVYIVEGLPQKLTPITSQLQHVFLVMRTFKINSLRHFQIYNTILLTIVTNAVRYIPISDVCSQPVTSRRPHVEVSLVH